MKTLLTLPILLVAIASPGRAQPGDIERLSIPDAAYQITARGQDFATYTRVTTTDDLNGWPQTKTNQFTLLENALHYHDDATGEWRESEDLIESFPDGAVARRGPHKAIFTHELNSQTVFDIQASDGKRIRGGVRAIQLTDAAAQRTITLATVKNSVIAQLLPPNTLVWADAFDGLKADVVINWKHGAWTHDILLKEQPELPLDWNPATTRLEILTEFILDADPELRKSAPRADGIQDHTIIDFGALAILVGKAFTIEQTGAFSFGGDLRSAGAPVRKQWMQTDDNRRFLIESLDWPTAQQSLQNLPLRRHASTSSTSGKVGSVAPRGPLPSDEKPLARTWPKTPPPLPDTDRKPIQLAAADYKPSGYLVDFITISGSTPTTFNSGTTYYIKTTYSSGSSVTVKTNAIIKFKNNAYMLLYGPVTFQNSGPKSIFTSRNDDSVGDIIRNVSGETDSNGDPSSHRANGAIWFYYSTYDVTVENAWIRWAKIGILNDRNSWETATQSITCCYFENITGTGSAGVSGDLSNVAVSNDLKKCKVTTPGVSMTLDCIGIENAWPGDASWKLDTNYIATAGWPTNITGTNYSSTPEIAGFASATSVNAGSSIDLYVDVRSIDGSDDSSYVVEFYRMGWYNGVGGRKMTWYDSTNQFSRTSILLPSKTQPVPEVDLSNGGIVDCLATTANGHSVTPWTLSYTFTVPSWWLSGVYLAKLTAATTLKQSYIIFTVREDSRGSDLYFKTSDTTWQAYNPWGGNSLYPYPYVTTCDPFTLQCPSCNPQRKYGTNVSFNRPYAGSPCRSGLEYGTGAGEFLVQINLDAEPGWEYNALRWLEKQG